MGLAFARWLARKSTLCFLRRLVAATGDFSPARRSYSAVARGSKPRKDDAEEDAEEQDNKKPYLRIGKSQIATRDESSEIALRISLNAGVQLFEPSTPPEESLRALQIQTGVGSQRALGELAVDRPENQGNLKLWVALLQYRERVDGFEGVLDVWRGMRRRDIDLPISGSEADILWSTFIHAGIRYPFDERHNRLLESVVDHARDLYPRVGLYKGIHTCIVGRCLRVYPSWGRLWHKTLRADFDITRIDWHALVAGFVHAKDRDYVRKLFRYMYTSDKQRDLYGSFVPEILKHHGENEALRWHQVFLKHGDGPDQETFANPAVQRLFQLDGDGSLPMVHRKRLATPPLASRDQVDFPPLTRATMSTLVGDVHGIKPKEVSDSFVAKMFATYAFSLDLVITGLGFFGVDNLGALSVREMALKAGTFAVFGNKLGDLKACGIGVEQSVYGRLMQKITVEGSVKLFDTLMTSDQHPESYEDTTTQELLLESFMQKDDWINAHITLMGLSLSGKVAHWRAWNRLLQHYISNRDYRAVSRTTEQMQTSGMAYTKRTLTFMHRHILPERHPGKAPIITPYEVRGLNPLQFTTNAYIYAARSGVFVDPQLWVENLKRFGLMYRWDELERLVLWLANWYSVHPPEARYRSRGQMLDRSDILPSIFTIQMRTAIVTWGFRHASRDKLLRPLKHNGSASYESWARGLVLLKRIQKYGIFTTPGEARKAFLDRMWILFGPAYSTKAVNVEAKRSNRLTLAHYVKHANHVWEGDLFKLDPELTNEEDPTKHPELLVKLFGRRRRVSKLRQEHADVAAYAETLAQRRVLYMPSRLNGLHRRRVWSTSPFRVERSKNANQKVQMRRKGPSFRGKFRTIY